MELFKTKKLQSLQSYANQKYWFFVKMLLKTHGESGVDLVILDDLLSCDRRTGVGLEHHKL